MEKATKLEPWRKISRPLTRWVWVWVGFWWFLFFLFVVFWLVWLCSCLEDCLFWKCWSSKEWPHCVETKRRSWTRYSSPQKQGKDAGWTRTLELGHEEMRSIAGLVWASWNICALLVRRAEDSASGTCDGQICDLTRTVILGEAEWILVLSSQDHGWSQMGFLKRRGPFSKWFCLQEI